MKETDEDELREELKFGWRMFETPKVEFYVTHDEEDLYIDGDGKMREEPVYFNDHMEANTGFSKFLKRKKEETESEDDIRFEREEYQTDWSSSEVDRKIDGFWYLTYQESEPMGEERRWAVFCRDKDLHVGPDGILTRKPFWFESEEKALEAYDRHLERVEEIGSLRKLSLSLMYAVFILPVKAVEALIHAFALPVKLFNMLMNTQLRMFGLTRGRRVSYVAEGVIMVAIAVIAFWINWLLGLLVLFYVGSALIYWGSPYQPYGPTMRPRWMRRGQEMVASGPPGLPEEGSNFGSTTDTRSSRTDSESEAYEDQTDFEG